MIVVRQNILSIIMFKNVKLQLVTPEICQARNLCSNKNLTKLRSNISDIEDESNHRYIYPMNKYPMLMQEYSATVAASRSVNNKKGSFFSWFD